MRRRIIGDLPNIVLLSLLIVMIIVVSRSYVSRERYFYYWDYAMYQQMSTDQVYTAKISLPMAIKTTVRSMSDDYNKLFTLPLIPVLSLSGQYFLRSTYISSLSLVYLFPYFLLIGLITRKIINSQPRIISWAAVFIAFLTPATWLPTLRGYPDSGGACLIAFALWTYLYDPKLRKWWQILIIGAVLAIAILFRRHFAYSVTAFLATAAIVNLVDFIVNNLRKQKYAVRGLLQSFFRLGLVLLTSLIVMLTLGHSFVQTVITKKSQLLYTAWQADPMTVFQSFRVFYGWLVILLAVAGLILGIGFYPQSRGKIAWITLFGGIEAVQWLFWVRQSNPQYSLHFTPIILLGLIIAVWVSWTKLKGVWRMISISSLAIFLAVNAIFGMTPNLLSANLFFNTFFATQTAPLQLPDYNQIVDLIHQLHNLNSKRDPMAVIASSGTLNYDLLSAADHVLYPSKPLKLIPAPEIDSRDEYPIEVFLHAKYILLTDPIQLHLAPSEQKVLRTVYQAFVNHWEITDNFTLLPQTYELIDNVKVNIYQRTQDISQETVIRTLEKIQESVGSRPIHQPDWVLLDNFSSNTVTSNQGTYRLKTILTTPANFLYLGNLPRIGKLIGTIPVIDPACGTVMLNLATASAAGIITPSENLVFQPGREQTIMMSFESQDAKFLLLTITRDESSTESCQVALKDLQVKNIDTGK